MADFQIAIHKTLAKEGGSKITETPGDAGGLTKFGISQRAYPTLDIRNITEQQASDIYRRDYWNRVCADRIVDQDVAESIFDFAVNAGPVTAIRLAQIAIGITNPERFISSATLARINAAPKHDFLASYALAKIARYAAICNKDKSQSKFLLGWILRALGS